MITFKSCSAGLCFLLSTLHPNPCCASCFQHCNNPMLSEEACKILPSLQADQCGSRTGRLARTGTHTAYLSLLLAPHPAHSHAISAHIHVRGKLLKFAGSHTATAGRCKAVTALSEQHMHSAGP